MMDAAGVPDALGASGMPMRTRLLGARLLTLLLHVRVSGEITYRALTGFSDPQRRLLSLIGNYGGATSLELVALSGMHKAQVSRTVAGLADMGLIRRRSLRSRVTLSPVGRAAFNRIMVIARERNGDLTDGIDADPLAWFAEATHILTDRAKAMLAMELERDGEEAAPEPPPMPERLRAASVDRPLSLIVAPSLITLVAYLQRSATLAYRRETGLSNFEWQLMTQIGESAPVSLTRLIGFINRDKSQVGRTVQRLEAAGAVVRVEPVGRSIMLDVTELGRAKYERIRQIAIARDDHLLDALGAGSPRYLALVEQLTANADRLLADARLRGA